MCFLLGYEAVNEQMQSNIRNWIQTIDQLNATLVKNCRGSIDGVIESLRSTTTQNPSLFAVLSYANNEISDPDFIKNVSDSVLQYMSLLLQRTSMFLASDVVRAINQIPLLLEDGDKNREQIVSDSKKLLEYFSEYSKTDFVVNSKEANSLVNILRSTIENKDCDVMVLSNAEITTARYMGLVNKFQSHSKIN